MQRFKRSGKSHPKVLYICGIAFAAVAAVIIQFGTGDSGWQKKTSFVGPAHPILVVAFSSDGERLASGDSEGDLFIWDWRYDKPLSIRRNPERMRILSLAFSPDSRNLVSGYSDGSARIWDVAENEGRVGALSRSDGPVRKLDVNDSGLVGVCYSPDGSTLATASFTGTIRLWDAALGEERASWRTHQESISCLAYSPNGKALATGSLDRTVTVWDATTTKQLASLSDNAAGIYSLAYSGNGKNLVAASADGAVKVWNTADWRIIETLQASHPLLLSVGMTADGRRIIAGGLEGFVNLWDLDTGRDPIVLKHSKEPWYKAVAISPDGTRLAFGMNSNFSVEGWEMRSHRVTFLP
jgi:WD40 repeat protein